MCQQCLDAVQKHWPDLTPSEAHTLLWEATCFPFGRPEQIEAQVEILARRSRRNLGFALRIADWETDYGMQGITTERMSGCR